jgi:rhodanese-related sulfurtransferase
MEREPENLHSLFNQLGFISGGIRNVSCREAFRLCNAGALMLDVRQPYMTSYKVADVQRLKLIPFKQLASESGSIDREEVIVCIDSVGLNSHEAWLMLKEMGFENVVNVAGGIVEWERDNLPMKINYAEMLTGSCACQLRARGKKKQHGN